MKLPFVSVVIPVRNEEKYIRQSLMSLINQTYPKNKYEIIIADGMSDDMTVEIIKDIQKKYRNLRIKVLRNRRFTTSTGFNLGARKSKSDIIVRAMGHAIADRNFIGCVVSKLMKESEDTIMVSCLHDTATKNSVGNLSGLAMQSMLGSMGSAYIKHNKKCGDFYGFFSGFGAIRRKKFLRIGGLDENLRCGDDAEINIRFGRNNLNVLMTSETKMHVFKRDSISKFIYQMFEFGEARMRLIKKYPDSFKIVYAGPPMFTLYIATIPMAFLTKLYLIPLVLYIILDFLSSIDVSKKLTDILPVMLMTFILHVSYGLGMIKGIFSR